MFSIVLLPLAHGRNSDLPPLTKAHQIFSGEGTPKPYWKHMKIRGEAGEQLLEVRIICTKISKGSGHEHSMGVIPKYVVVTWIQIRSFDELQCIYIKNKTKKVSWLASKKKQKDPRFILTSRGKQKIWVVLVPWVRAVPHIFNYFLSPESPTISF